MIRVVVADKNETMRLGIRTLFDKHPSKFAVSEVADRAALMNRIQDCDCDLVVVEPLLCAGAGEALIRQIRRISQANVLVYTELDELKYGVDAIRCGARGYLMKSRPSSELLAAASKVGAGKMHMSDALAEEVALHAWEGKQELPHETLSERERMVFSMLVCGWTVTKIGAALNLSVKTISTHKARTMQKLRCKSLSEMIEYAFSNGLKQECEVRCKSW
jgi:DNA-binding NarL/FixJ family response regulator